MKLVMCVVGIDISIFKFQSVSMVFSSVVFVCKFLMVIILKIVGL